MLVDSSEAQSDAATEVLKMMRFPMGRAFKAGDPAAVEQDHQEDMHPIAAAALSELADIFFH
eukprot:1017073-Alexandrium_andersonii.AAC.1